MHVKSIFQILFRPKAPICKDCKYILSLANDRWSAVMMKNVFLKFYSKVIYREPRLDAGPKSVSDKMTNGEKIQIKAFND